MLTMAKMVDSLGQMDNIDEIIFEFDSPGGQVKGTQTLAKAIKNSPKKTTAVINDGMACSAAYWIASSCQSVFLAHNTDQVGSIGVMTTFADMKDNLEKQGIKLHEVTAAFLPKRTNPEEMQ
jgi:protease IV